MSYLTYVRSRATWLEVYQSIMDSVVTPVHYKPEDLRKKPPMVAADYLESKAIMSAGQLCLQPKEKDTCTRRLYKVAGVAAAVWSLFVFITQLTACFSSDYTLTNVIAQAAPEQTFVNFVVGIFFLAGLVATCMFSIFNASLSGTLLQLR